MDTPLVSVICLSYNHVRFVREAIESAMKQTYASIQLIVVDDASSDGSQDEIRAVLENYPDVIFIALEKNQGNCRAFNKGFEIADGDFVIDLAADDVLLPNRVEQGIKSLQAAGLDYGVQFSDAEIITEEGMPTGFHSDKYPHATIPQGEIYKDLIGRYFINSPTMMIRRTVMEALGGYDETLAYEDFDFWIRSSRLYKYCYVSQALIRRRIVGTSMTRQQYKRNSPQLQTTFRVCEKIKLLNRTTEEDRVLKGRIWYEMRKAFAVGEMRLVMKYVSLWWTVRRRRFAASSPTKSTA